MSVKRPRAIRRRPELTPLQRPAWQTVGVSAGVAVAGAGALFAALTWLLGIPLHVSGSAAHASEQRKLLVEVFKAALGLAAGLGAVVALALNYRRHRIDESQSHRDDQRLFTERFGSAAEQLGHVQPAVRLAGVHALARLADDWEEQRQTCIDVLCAYVRLPPIADPAHEREQHEGTGKPAHPVTPRAEREVRQTIVRLIADHLRVGLDEKPEISWQGLAFDFTGAQFDGAFDFSDATFSGGHVSFSGATFSGGHVDFNDATFSGGKVDFSEATFSGGDVGFSDATFSGGHVDFGAATFSGGNVYFSRATFSGGDVGFRIATFSGGTSTSTL